VHLHAQREPGDDELVNRAALKTLACGRQIRVWPLSEFDEGVRMAAIFRYELASKGVRPERSDPCYLAMQLYEERRGTEGMVFTVSPTH
jgi:hypothetical protein